MSLDGQDLCELTEQRTDSWEVQRTLANKLTRQVWNGLQREALSLSQQDL